MVPYGGFWWRVLAYILDGIILNVAATIVGAMLGIGTGLSMYLYDTQGFASAAIVKSTSVSFLFNWLYFALMESSRLQATVGKLVIGLVVTDLNGERISFLRATGRYFAKILSALILCIGFIMVAFNARKQGLHDLLAGSLVYKTRNPGDVYDTSDVFA